MLYSAHHVCGRLATNCAWLMILSTAILRVSQRPCSLALDPDLQVLWFYLACTFPLGFMYFILIRCLKAFFLKDELMCCPKYLGLHVLWWGIYYSFYMILFNGVPREWALVGPVTVDTWLLKSDAFLKHLGCFTGECIDEGGRPITDRLSFLFGLPFQMGYVASYMLVAT